MDIPVNSNMEEYEIELKEEIVIGEVTLNVGDTVTGEAGTDALVENTGDDKNIVLKFTIPRGANGADGDDGVGIASVVLNQDYTLTITLTDGRSYTTTSIRGASGDDGYSPIASVSKSGKITTISITDESGTTTAEVHDGEDGQSGSDGVGIDSVVLNSDYTLTITLTDGTSYTTTSIRGATGSAGRDGQDGYSPEVTIDTITGGHRVTITDAEHPSGQSFDVHDGEDGQSGSDGVGIASVVLNQDYTLTITLTNGTSYTTTSIRGETGPAGQSGDDGYSPEVTIDTITGGHRVTITDAEHPTGQSFDVLDGQGGGSSDTVPVAIASMTNGVISATISEITTLQNGTRFMLVLPSTIPDTTAFAKMNLNDGGAVSIYNTNNALVKAKDLKPYDVKTLIYMSTFGSHSNCYVMIDHGITPEQLGFCYGSSTESGTSKKVTMPGFRLAKGAMVAVNFTNAVGNNSTLNVNDTGAKSIYYKSLPIQAGIINALDTAVFMYDGYYWQLIAVNTAVGNATVYGTCTPSSSSSSMTATTNRPLTKVAGATATIKFNADVTWTGPLLQVGDVNLGISARVHHKGVDMPANTIKSGDTATFVYDGTYWNLIAIDTIGGGGSYDDGDAISY